MRRHLAARGANEELRLRFKCRLFQEMVWLSKCSVGTNGSYLALQAFELEEGLQCFLRWLKRLEEQLDRGAHNTCVLDPFEVVTIALTSVKIRRSIQDPLRGSLQQCFSEIHILSISLLAMFSKRSPVNGRLRKLVSSIALDGTLGINLENAESSADLEGIPRKLYNLLRDLHTTVWTV